MKITPILTQLRAQCPTLANRIAAGIDLTTLQANTPLTTPCAYIVPSPMSPAKASRRTWRCNPSATASK